jgi:hypothetical protein
MATELKSDSWHRYMLYCNGDTSIMPYASRKEKQHAVDDGKKFTMAAYPDVWAKDVGLVKRVRRFLGENFHWHDRLAKFGSDLEVVQTLFDMVRGGSIAVIPEGPVRSGGISYPQQKAGSSFWGVENYGESAFVSLKERYRAQLERMNADQPTWAETVAMMDGINASFMAQTAGRSPLLDAVFRAAGWADKYADVAGGTSSLLGDGQPFAHFPLDKSGLGDTFDIAKTPNFGEPGRWYTNPGSGQMRLYGSTGAPVVDLDFDHFHNGLKPHAHNWGPNGRDGGDDVVPFSPWKP